MAQRKVHLDKYHEFRKDAFHGSVGAALRVEAMFLASYQLIDACAARVNVHVGKHQNIRRELEANVEVLGPSTKEVWQSFQELETRIRPRFVYGQRSDLEDFARAMEVFARIERLCLPVVQP